MSHTHCYPRPGLPWAALGRLPSLLNLHFLTCQVGRQTQPPPWLSGQQKILLQSLAGNLLLSGRPQSLPSTQLTQVKVVWLPHPVRAKVGMSLSLCRTSSETHAGGSALAIFASGAEHTAAMGLGRHTVPMPPLSLSRPLAIRPVSWLDLPPFPQPITLASTNLNTDYQRQRDDHPF